MHWPRIRGLAALAGVGWCRLSVTVSQSIKSDCESWHWPFRTPCAGVLTGCERLDAADADVMTD